MELEAPKKSRTILKTLNTGEKKKKRRGSDAFPKKRNRRLPEKKKAKPNAQIGNGKKTGFAVPKGFCGRKQGQETWGGTTANCAFGSFKGKGEHSGQACKPGTKPESCVTLGLSRKPTREPGTHNTKDAQKAGVKHVGSNGGCQGRFSAGLNREEECEGR